MLVEQTSSSTLVGEEDNEMTHCSRQPRSTDKNKEQVALKLNRLKNKAVRYKSHKDFLSRRIAEGPVPKGLKLDLDPTIGNYDKEFVDTWYSKLKTFSLILMKDTVAHCDKTIVKTNDNIKDTETNLKKKQKEENTRALKKPSKTMKQTQNVYYNEESSKS